MNEKSFEVFSKERAAADKFDYYICSVAGALFAYVGQTYTPHKFDSAYYLITPAALICLTFCFFFGCIVIYMSKEVLKLNKEYLTASETCQNYTNNLNNVNSVLFNSNHGGTVGRADLEKMRDAAKLEFETKRKIAGKKDSIADKLSILRNCFLVAGFILIFVAKILQPYWTK